MIGSADVVRQRRFDLGSTAKPPAGSSPGPARCISPHRRPESPAPPPRRSAGRRRGI